MTIPAWAVHAALPDMYPAMLNTLDMKSAIQLVADFSGLISQGSIPVSPELSSPAVSAPSVPAPVVSAASISKNITVDPILPEGASAKGLDLDQINLQTMSQEELENALQDQLLGSDGHHFWTTKKTIIAGVSLLAILLILLVSLAAGASGAGGGSGASGGGPGSAGPQLFNEPPADPANGPLGDVPGGGEGFGDPDPNGGNPPSGNNPNGSGAPGSGPAGGAGGPVLMGPAGNGPNNGPNGPIPQNVPMNPEPSTLLLFGLGALVMLRKRGF